MVIYGECTHVFGGGWIFQKPDRFKFLTYFVKNFYSLSKP